MFWGCRINIYPLSYYAHYFLYLPFYLVDFVPAYLRLFEFDDLSLMMTEASLYLREPLRWKYGLAIALYRGKGGQALMKWYRSLRLNNEVSKCYHSCLREGMEGVSDGGDFFQTEEILTGSLLPSLPKPVNNIALLVGTDADGKNKVCSVSSLFV